MVEFNIREEFIVAMLVAVYKSPKNPVAFNSYYFSKHVPLAKTIPGLRSYEVSDGTIGVPVAPGNVYLIAMLHFDSVAAINAGLASPQGQAAAGDLVNFADGGVDLMVFDTKAV